LADPHEKLYVRFNNLTELKTTHDVLLAESPSGPSIVFIVQPRLGLGSASINNGLNSGSRRHAAFQELATLRRPWNILRAWHIAPHQGTLGVLTWSK
jgi:hypothetical protein